MRGDVEGGKPVEVPEEEIDEEEVTHAQAIHLPNKHYRKLPGSCLELDRTHSSSKTGCFF